MELGLGDTEELELLFYMPFPGFIQSSTCEELADVTAADGDDGDMISERLP